MSSLQYKFTFVHFGVLEGRAIEIIYLFLTICACAKNMPKTIGSATCVVAGTNNKKSNTINIENKGGRNCYKKNSWETIFAVYSFMKGTK